MGRVILVSFLSFLPAFAHQSITMPRLALSASTAILASFALAASAKPCVQFDASWNLYAFGGSEDVSLGQNTTWGCESPGGIGIGRLRSGSLT